MDYEMILIAVISAILLPLLAWGMTYLTAYLREKASYIEDEAVRLMVLKAVDIVEQAVLYVMQTYVDGLKKAGKFDKAAQEEAFQMAKERAVSLINDEAKNVIEENYGDFDTWIETRIEEKVHENKM